MNEQRLPDPTNDPAQDAGDDDDSAPRSAEPTVIDADESRAAEAAGDSACETGDLLWALIHYRKAAELRPDDPALETKIAAALEARAATVRPPNGPPPAAPAPRETSKLTILMGAALVIALGSMIQNAIENTRQPITSASTTLEGSAASPDASVSRAEAAQPPTMSSLPSSSEAVVVAGMCSEDERGARPSSPRSKRVQRRPSPKIEEVAHDATPKTARPLGILQLMLDSRS
jgi:hypothetical protein